MPSVPSPISIPLSSDCLRLKKKGYKLSGLYSVKSDIDGTSGLKTIYCDFTTQQQQQQSINKSQSK